MATKQEILVIFDMINANYPNNKYELSEPLIDIWHMLLGHYSLIDLQTAVLRTLDTSKYPPTAADISEAMRGLVGLGIPGEGEAWHIVSDAILYCGLGRYHKGEERLKPYPLIVHAVEQIGGLQAIDEADNTEVIRGQFMRIYSVIRKQAQDTMFIPPLVLERAKALGKQASHKLLDSIERPDKEQVARIGGSSNVHAA